MTVKLWQVVAVVAGTTFFVGLLAGRYVVPHKSAREQAIESLLKQSQNEFALKSDELASQADVRAAVPALEAWNADHGTYVGANLDTLQTNYDSSIQGVHAVWTTGTAYCVESMTAPRYHKQGPAGDILRGPC